MFGRLGAAALIVALLSTTSACGRSDEEISALRQAVEAELAAAPLPPGAELVRGRFDKGCHDFFECADGPDRPAFYEADLYLGRPLSSAVSMCAFFVEMLRGAGFRLAGRWDSTRFEVDEAACAAGHPGAGTVVRADGKSFSDKATLEFSLLDGDMVAPRYKLVHEPHEPHEPMALTSVRLTRSVVAHIRGALDREFVLDGDMVAPRYKLVHEPHEPMALTSVRLTRSVVAHIRGALDREFVLDAVPEVDGITTGHTTGGQWTVPATTTSLRFDVTCDERDEVWLEAHDPNIAGKPYGWGRRVVQCTGAATTVDMPVSLEGDKAYVGVSVYGRPASVQRQPPRNGNYSVRFISAS